MSIDEYYRNTCKVHNVMYNEYCLLCHPYHAATLKKDGITVPGTDTWKPFGKDTRLTTKDTNPKDAVGTKKVPFSTIPATVIAELGIALLEGARKYGRHNYRVASVRYSVYYDATLRHLTAWWEGQDIDPDSGLSHITKAIAGLTVLRDAMIHGKVVDDRPPVSPENWLKDLQPKVDDIFERHPTSVPAYTQVHD